MNKHLVLLLSFVLTAPLYAQEKNAEIDRIFSWAGPGAPGCAVAVSLNGKMVVNRAYGSADLERDVPITPQSVFDAGSVVKQFVAAATLVLVSDGRIALSDDVRKHVPELPDYGQRITVDHLLTHTSGIRDWTGLLMLARTKNDALTMILRQRGLNFAPGEEWEYSNSGYVLLKEIVARASGMSFGEFAHKRLFEPLGMTSTVYQHDLREIVKNRALAYDKEGGRWKLAVLLDEERGGGGALLTTAADLVIWNDALTGGRLGAFVTEKLQEPARLDNGRKLDYARGLIIGEHRGAKQVWHSGSAHGYKTLVARYPEHALSIAMTCNSGDGTERGPLAHQIFDLFVPNAPAPAAEANAPAAAASADPAKAGLFFNERTGTPLQLVVSGGRLRIAGGPALVAVDEGRFRNPRGLTQFMSRDEFELHFVSQDQFELKSMEGKTTRYRRAQPYAPSAADLQAFAGRYANAEMDSVFIVAAGKEGLTLRLEHAPDKSLPLAPVDRDTFQVSRMFLRFVRGEDGRVLAIDYSNPVLRNIRFTRL